MQYKLAHVVAGAVTKDWLQNEGQCETRADQGLGGDVAGQQGVGWRTWPEHTPCRLGRTTVCRRPLFSTKSAASGGTGFESRQGDRQSETYGTTTELGSEQS